MKIGKKTYTLLILIITIFVSSCDNVMPAEFWEDYHPKNIQSKINDQGPWGGNREIVWFSILANKFESIDMIAFATKNDWKIIDSLTVSEGIIVPDIDIEDYANELLMSKIKLNIKWTNFKVYRFKTGWVKVEPGNLRETFKNGIVAIKSDMTEMSIYHFWGE